MASFVRQLTLVPFEADENKRRTIVMCECLKQVSFTSFIALLIVSKKRINLDIKELEVQSLSHAKEAIAKSDFMYTLMEADHY